MKFYLFTIISFLLFACTDDCSECQQKLRKCIMSAPIPLDPIAPNPGSYEKADSILEIGVSSKDTYLYNNSEYSLEEITPIITGIMHSIAPSERKLKISGDKMAHFEAVFALLTLGKKNRYNPILNFSSEATN